MKYVENNRQDNFKQTGMSGAEMSKKYQTEKDLQQ